LVSFAFLRIITSFSLYHLHHRDPNILATNPLEAMQFPVAGQQVTHCTSEGGKQKKKQLLAVATGAAPD
jgi:hypothetical protein